MMKDQWDAATFEELKNGYARQADDYQCLFCVEKFKDGHIYPTQEGLVDARQAAKIHIREAHGSAFRALIAGEKKDTGLSSVQKEFMNYFFEGLPDKKIAEMTKTSPSTVRFQRFSLREKARQARVFLALFELMEGQARGKDLPDIHKGATMVDERYWVTDEEIVKIVQNYFSSVEPLILKTFPSREKKKLVVLKRIAGQFDPGLRYDEKQVNTILKPIFGDFATIRRYLIEYGFMKRTADGSAYWLSEADSVAPPEQA
jgi:hypothetical protein